MSRDVPSSTSRNPVMALLSSSQGYRSVNGVGIRHVRPTTGDDDSVVKGLPSWLRQSLVAIAAVLVVLGGALVWGVHLGPTPAGAWYAGIAAVIAWVALAMASVAVVLTYPTYATWADAQRRHPDMEVYFGLRSNLEDDVNEPFDRVDDGGTWDSPARRFLVRVVLHNHGDAPLDGLLNIIVPADCELLVMGESPHHRRAPYQSVNEHLIPGKDVDCRWTVVERTFVPDTSFVYYVEVRPPRELQGTVPVVADLSGAVTGSTIARMEVNVPGPGTGSGGASRLPLRR